jgi:hypothetical protein
MITLEYNSKVRLLIAHSIPYYLSNEKLFASNEDDTKSYTDITKYSISQLLKFLGY